MKQRRRRQWNPGPRCRKDWSVEQRLARHAVRDPLSGCWLWQSCLVAGYGRIHVHGRQLHAHRWVWEMLRGPIPPGMILCHRCDESRCCNPDHLFLGTRGHNMADLKAKQLHRADARAGTAAASGSGGEATIRIIYRGVELVGQVKVAAVDPRVRAVEAAALIATPPPRTARFSTPARKESP